MVTAKQLPSGFWLVRGSGPCEWSQPPFWPCDERTLRDYAFPEASEGFIHEAARASETVTAVEKP